MPALSRWFIKIGLIYFVVSLIMGALLLAQPVFGLSPRLALLRPVYLHLLVLGWLTQFIFGVAYWMFPKSSREHPRGSERLGWAVLILLNLGLVLRSIAEPLVVFQPGSGFGWVLVLAALCLLLAGWGFILNTWQRVKER